jgi:methylthioribose-1-phosphate isomerase
MADPPPALHWDGERLHVLDQTRLPHEEAVIELTGAADTAEAIKRLSVRGAPLIGIAAAYGLAMEVAARPDLGALEAGAERLRTARPTAVNLAWAVDRVRDAALAAGPRGLRPLAARGPLPQEAADAARAEAEAIEREDIAMSRDLARHGADALQEALAGLDRPARILTHCNSGALAASGRGTGLGVILELADRRPVEVLACEARPLLQGARLTAWELARAGVPHALCVDGAAPGLIRSGQVDAVVTGFDRVAANGDVANKVGTYPLALAADAAGIPFVAAGPSSSVDEATATGDDIEIEERGADEVLRDWAPAGTRVRNPAFDVTPGSLVWALVTEAGVRRR